MATAATPLLAGFDFDFAPSPQTPENEPIAFLPLTRPPTPDPRHPFRPHLQRRPQDCYSQSPLPREQHNRTRRKLPALSLNNSSSRAEAPPLSASSNASPHTCYLNRPHTALNSSLHYPPSTPSPRNDHFAPSLSSSGTTIQSSPTTTPSGERSGFRSEQSQRLWTGQRTSQWSVSDRKLVLKRAKRLPHHNSGLWEVHAVVHVGSGSEQQQQQQVLDSKPQHQEVDASFSPAFEFPSTTAEPSVSLRTNGTSDQAFADLDPAPSPLRPKRSERGVRFLGISSESASREGGLRKAHEAESSTFTLSKYQFPPPPAPRHSPATVHYRGTSFDLVNPHTSLLLSPPDLETPAEIDGLLDDYFDDDPMPRQLYADAGAARRGILRFGEDVRAAPSGAAGDPSPVSSETERSDPFALTLSESEEGESAAHEPQGDDSALDSTVDGILAGYDYSRVTAPPPSSHEATLRALEGTPPSGDAGGRASATSSWLESQFAHGLGAAPTTSRTYGDTNVLLGIGAPEDAALPQMRAAPSRSMTLRESDFGGHSARVSLHDGGSGEPSIPAMWSSGDLPEQRRGRLEHYGLTQPSSGVMGRRESIYDGLDEGGDWVTDREPTMGYQEESVGRPSEESYANTSHYSEQNRLSAFTDVDLHSVNENSTVEAPVSPDNRRQAATHDRTNSSDVRKASKYLFESARDKAEHVFKSHRDKVVNQELEASLLSGVPMKMSKSRRDAERHRLEHYRNQRDGANEEQGITSDAELEQLRQRNPHAVRIAVDNATEMMRRQRQAAGTGIRRVRDMFRNSIHDLIPGDRPETACELANLDHRGLISAIASSTGHRSGLAWSDTNHTFHTVRDSNSIIAGLPGSHFDPVFGNTPPIATPPTAMTTGPRIAYNSIARTTQPGDRPAASHLAKGKRRAAMSGQTELRPFEISGSPTSNIQGAFTDRELIDSEHRWRTNPPPAHRAQNMSGLLPQYSLRTSRPGHDGRMLIRPDERMTESDRRIQVQISKHYLYRCLLFPPALLMYTTGRLDHLILERTHGRITKMSQEAKDDAAKFAIAGALGWAFLAICIVCVVALTVKSLQ